MRISDWSSDVCSSDLLFASLEALNEQLERRVRERTAERERSQDSLRQVQKLDMLGQLTGHVAHDFNNLLMPIVGGLDLILSGKRTPESIERHATIAMQAEESAQTQVQRSAERRVGKEGGSTCSAGWGAYH